MPSIDEIMRRHRAIVAAEARIVIKAAPWLLEQKKQAERELRKAVEEAITEAYRAGVMDWREAA